MNGFTFNNGETKTLYSANSVNCGSCDDVKGDFMCEAGTVSGDTSGMDYDSCDDSQCSCTFEGNTIADGDSLTVYEDDIPCDTCSEGTVYCNGGVTSGDTTFVFTSCDALNCGCEVLLTVKV